MAERADNYKVLENIRKSSEEHYQVIKDFLTCLNRSPYVPGICILDSEEMTEEEKKETIIFHHISRGMNEKDAKREAEEVISMFKLLDKVDTIENDIITPNLKMIKLKKGETLDDKIKEPEN